MTTTAKILIDRSVQINKLTNPVSYDDNHTGPAGYFLCRECHATTKSSDCFPIHNYTCKVFFKKGTEHSEMIYVFGPSEDAYSAFFHSKNVELIKEAAIRRVVLLRIVSKIISKL